MATRQDRENRYARQIKQSKGQKKRSLFQPLGTGRVGRYARAGMLVAGMLHPSGPSGASAFSEEQATTDQSKYSNRQGTYQRVQQQQTPEEAMFGQDIDLSSDEAPTQSVNFSDLGSRVRPEGAQQEAAGEQTGLENEPRRASQIPLPGGGRGPGQIAQAKPLTQEEQERFGSIGQNETQAQEDERFRKMGEEQRNQGRPEYASKLPLPGGGRGPGQIAQAKPLTADEEAAAERKGGKVEKGGQNASEAGEGELPGNVGRILSMQKMNALKNGDIKGAVNEAVNQGANLATAQALAWSWRVLIPTFGLTILYINFHFVAKYIAHSEKFCDFGDEWKMINPEAAAGGAPALKRTAAAQDAALEYLEIMAMVLIDFLVAILLTLVIIFGYAIINPEEILETLV